MLRCNILTVIFLFRLDSKCYIGARYCLIHHCNVSNFKYCILFKITNRNQQTWTDLIAVVMSVHLQVIALILTGVGLVCSGIFHVGTKEPPDDSPAERKLPHSIADYVVNFGYTRATAKRNLVFPISSTYSSLRLITWSIINSIINHQC